MVDFGSVRRLFVLAACLGLVATSSVAQAEEVTVTSAFAEFGEPALDEGFAHFPYVDPNAPKGGKIVLHWADH